MIATTCPSHDCLAGYVRGQLDLAAHESVEDHLDECSTCAAQVEALDRDTPSLLSSLHTPRPEIPPEEPAFRRLVERVKSFDSAIRDACPAGTLGNYELLEPVGAGGMGRVYKARHQRMKRIVALKVLAPELLRSGAMRARFQREVEAAARVSSPHIVTAYDAGESNGCDFLVMEYVEGVSLADLVKRDGPLPVGRALSLVLQAARGLAHAHAAGLVHRDVKPANLLLDNQGTVKVLDLGLARALFDGDGSDHPSKTGTGMGTPAFMAPEQAADAGNADARADVYGLGCTLFYLLTGRPPFDGATAIEAVRAHREQPIPSIPALAPGVAAFLNKAMAKRPEDRHETMNAVISELERLTSSARPRRRLWIAAAGAIAASVALWMYWPGAAPPAQPKASTPVAKKDQPADSARVPAVVAAGMLRSPVIKMVAIKPGEFFMGSADDDKAALPEEKPRQKVTMTRPFMLGAFEVTQEEYDTVMGTNPSHFSPKNEPRLKDKDTRTLPVDTVSWLDAIRFCNMLSLRHGLEPYYEIKGETVTRKGGSGYRLPTEAEWEYACRAGTSTRWCFGDDEKKLDDFAWFAGNSDNQTHAVGTKKPNAWGLYDMYGNVAEWCWDRYKDDVLKRIPATDPPGPGEGATRVHRGGEWNSRLPQARSASRSSLGLAYVVEGSPNRIGFRVARDGEE